MACALIYIFERFKIYLWIESNVKIYIQLFFIVENNTTMHTTAIPASMMEPGDFLNTVTSVITTFLIIIAIFDECTLQQKTSYSLRSSSSSFSTCTILHGIGK